MRCNNSRVVLAIIVLLCSLAGHRALALDPSCPKLDVPLAALLMPPPKHDSAQTKAELDELVRLQELRTSDQVKHAKEDDHRTLERFLGGIGIKVENLSASAKSFFDCIGDSVREATHEVKGTFMRTRPYRLPHNKLHILKTPSDRDSSSYPSVHATYGAAVGLVLAEIIPEKKEAIYRRIHDYAYSRLLSGVHFRSEIYAGEIAGVAIAASLMNKEAFRDQLKDVRAELRKTIGITP